MTCVLNRLASPNSFNKKESKAHGRLTPSPNNKLKLILACEIV